MSAIHVEEGKIPNADLARAVFPYARLSVWIAGVVNVILFLLSFKWPQITKLYFYIMFYHHVNEMLLPYDIPEASSNILRIITGVVDFIACYFHWWPALILSMLNMFLSSLGRAMFYEMPFDSEAIIKTIVNMILVGVMVWFCHIVVTYAGMVFIEVQIVRAGNEQILDDLEEGVIIQNPETQEVIYMNEAAKLLGRMQSGDKFSQSIFDRLTSAEVNQENKLFAHVASKLLADGNIVDSEQIFKSIKAIDDYKSIQEIISAQEADNFPGKSLFKHKMP